MKYVARCSLMAALLISAPASLVMAEEVIVYHTWSSPAEVNALNILHERLAAAGHTWTDVAIPHDTGSNVSLLNLIQGGNPPNVFMENDPGFYRDLRDMGLSRSLNDLFEAEGYAEHLPAAVLESLTVDGDIVKVPLGIHIDGMVYYNMEVAAAAGVDPAAWSDLEDMFADFPAIREAGYIPVAIGAQQWQVGYLGHTLAASLGGADFYTAIYGETPDPARIDSTEMRDVLSWVRRFQQEADAGSVNRDWNATTYTVIDGQALMQIHGDWMKGEWLAAGKVAGTDFGCIGIPGAAAYVVTVDNLGFLGGQSDAMDAAEMDFARIVLDPATQGAFAAAKGATPPRFDAEGDLDLCSRTVEGLLQDPETQVPSTFMVTDADWNASMRDVFFAFWSNPEMTTDEAIEMMVDNYDAILG